MKVKKLSEEELWEKIEDRSIDQFSKLCATFINRARQDHTAVTISKLIEKHNLTFDHERTFLKSQKHLRSLSRFSRKRWGGRFFRSS